DWLDLVPSWSHPGGSGQEWDRFALQSSVSADLGDGVMVRHASAPAFLALKWAAYGDRGVTDPFASHDLEDIPGAIDINGVSHAFIFYANLIPCSYMEYAIHAFHGISQRRPVGYITFE
ncbi:MAG: hypothetical protein MUE58_12445, partial [Chitinophagaceae bacterium]|nr:hypothetical protein [Chitinophagaceae bacterium]